MTDLVVEVGAQGFACIAPQVAAVNALEKIEAVAAGETAFIAAV
jgi:hypothetical protein